MSVRAALEAVIFDAGGTLVRLDFEWMSATVTGLGYALDPAVLRRSEVEGRRRFDASHGHPPAPGEASPPLGTRGDTAAYFGGMLEAAGVPARLVPPALEAFGARHRDTGLWTRPVEGARSALDALRLAGYRLACVSNSDGRAERHLVDCGVRDGLEFVVDSELVGVEKPDPAIFRIALERLGVAAERAIYVGDIVSVDAAGAAAAGMHFVLLDGVGGYAPAGVVSIASIHRLPGHLAAHFSNASSPASHPFSNRAVP